MIVYISQQIFEIVNCIDYMQIIFHNIFLFSIILSSIKTDSMSFEITFAPFYNKSLQR